MVLIVLFTPVLNTSTTFYGDIKNDFKQLKYILKHLQVNNVSALATRSASTELKFYLRKFDESKKTLNIFFFTLNLKTK